MIEPIDTRLTPLLLLAADWSLRWAVVLAALAVALKVWPPRRPATRLLLCRLALVGGLLLPLLPRCWGPTLSHAESAEAAAIPRQEETPQFPLISRTIPQQREIAPIESPPPSASAAQAPTEQTTETAAIKPPASLGFLRWSVLAVAAVWFGGVALMGTRLLAAWVSLARFRRGASLADEPA